MDDAVYAGFCSEIEKIADDAEMRTQKADRLGLKIGEDYLPGGRLASNDSSETNFVPKIAATAPPVQRPDDFGNRLKKVQKKFHSAYNKVREPAAAGGKGALYATVAANLLSGGKAKGYRGYTIPALAGAAAGVADHYAQGKKKQQEGMPKKAAIPRTSMSTFTPARQLTRGRHTGGFLSMVHKGDKLSPPTVGKKFKIPESPTE